MHVAALAYQTFLFEKSKNKGAERGVGVGGGGVGVEGGGRGNEDLNLKARYGNSHKDVSNNYNQKVF